MNNEQDIIITGATGFVGRSVVRKISKYFEIERVVCFLWNKNTGNEKKGRKLIKDTGITCVEGDLVTGEGLYSLPKKPSLIIHLAANTDTSDPDHRVNDLGTVNLYKHFGTLYESTHFVHASTIAVSGGRSDCTKPVDEKTKYAATNEYGRTKLNAEKFLFKQCKDNNFRLSVLRLNTIYGPDARENSMFPMLKHQILKGSIASRLNWPGLTSLIHVEDAAEVILKLSTLKPARGEPDVYVLSNDSLTLAEINKKMYAAMGQKYSQIRLDDIFWKTTRLLRGVIPVFEKILGPSLYNWLWRFSLIVDNAVWSDGSKVKRTLPDWKPSAFDERLEDVV